MRSIKQDEYFRAYFRGKTNERISALFLDGYTADMTLSPAMREAHGLHALWSNAPLSVYPQELIVGGIFATEVAGFHYGDGVWLNEERLSLYMERHGLDESYRAKADMMLQAVYQNPYNKHFNPALYTAEELASIRSTAASSTWFGGHLSMDYETILAIGLGGYADRIAAARAKHPDAVEYYDALAVTLNAMQVLIKRTANRCGELAVLQLDADFKDNMIQAENALRAIVTDPPTTFHQALQLVTMVHICSDADSFGRFDSYLRPFFEADIQAGRLTTERALDLLQSLVIKVEQQEQIQNMTIGGILPDGGSGYSALTQLMLKAVRNMRYKGPNLCMRVHPDMPQSFWQDITDTIETGQGLPALYNDSVIVSTLVAAGYPVELARDYCLGGCSQIMFGGRCQFVNDIGMMNIAKIMELTLHNGRDPLSGEQAGPETGEPTAFTDFDALYEAFNRQLEYFIALEASINNKDILDRGSKEGYTVRSLFTRGCIESGKGVYEGGALYNHVQLECIGITNVADSLYAIKQLVYTDNQLTLAELVDVLDSNFAGEAEAVRTALRKVDKFGNDSDGVDSIRADITRRLYAGLRAQKGAFGGNYIPGEVIFTAHEHCGNAVGATPDGRYAHEVLADSAGSSQGMDMHGPTALMNSVLKIPIEGMITSVVLNMKFHRDFFKDNADTVAALFRGYFAGGGEQLQINVCDNEELKQALIYPERYQNLVVRVGGYSDYFVRLNRRLQEEIILRSSSIM